MQADDGEELDMRRRYLRIYLNDHFALATAGRELVRRTLASNRGTPLGGHLASLHREIVEDRETLQKVMRAVGARVDQVKVGMAWMGEKVARLKLNGRIVGYSDLSRVVELEALGQGVEWKRDLWRSLAVVAPTDPSLVAFDFEALAGRAQRQRDELEPYRVDAIRRAFREG